ncbi:MAG: hypothetical protein ABI851_05420 [Saprospiraceae bacterium]
MKKKEKNNLKGKLFLAVKKVLTTNNSIITDKIEKTLKKSIKLIVKNIKQKIITRKKPIAAKI